MTECLIYDKNERHNFSIGQKSNFSILYKYFSTFLKIIFVYKFIGAYKEAIKNKFHILQMYINSQDFLSNFKGKCLHIPLPLRNSTVKFNSRDNLGTADT